MKALLTPLALLAWLAPLASSAAEPQQPRYEATWQSLEKHDETPQWLKDAKFGIYFTWGVFSVPAYYNEWYPFHQYRQNTAVAKHHKATYGDGFEYHDFVPQFTAEQFDPKEWAQLFKDTGARFAGPCGMHHDGFCLWESDVNPWNAADKGPKRDLMGSLFTELRAQDIKTITTLHHARHLQRNAKNKAQWARNGSSNCGADSHYPYDPELITSTKDPELKYLYGNFEEEEGVQYWTDICNEVIDKYSPDILWFDSWLNLIPEKARQEMAAHYFNEADKKKQDVVIGYKQNDMPHSVGIEDVEQGGLAQVSDRTWMTDVTLSEGYGSWSYVKGQRYKTPELLLRNMIDAWSKNGIVLLNISPKADGSIGDDQRGVLKQIGDWLKVHGEAVYNTHAFTVHGFGSAKTAPGYFGGQSANTEYTAADVRYTVANDNKSFYVFILGQPKPGAQVYLPTLYPHNYTLPAPIKKATVLGTGEEVKINIDQDFFRMDLPQVEMNPLATVIKFELGE